MTFAMIDAAEARRRLANGTAVLVDIREPMEHAREKIPGARSHPLSGFDAQALAVPPGQAVIFHCQSGRRTHDNAARLAGCGANEVFVLDGGLAAWKAAGGATRLDRSRPIEIQRQVQIVAGALVLSGLLLAWLVNPLFLGLSGFVGAGLMFAGISGWCGMAKILAVLPWNRLTP